MDSGVKPLLNEPRKNRSREAVDSLWQRVHPAAILHCCVKSDLERGRARDARAGMQPETVAARREAVFQGAASLRWQRRRSGRASACYCDRRIAEIYRSRCERAYILRIRAPVQRLIAELQVQIARCSKEINAWRIESGCDVGLCKVKKSWPCVRWISNRKVEPAIRCMDR